MTNQWWQQPTKALSLDMLEQAQQHQNMLTKPQGSLGRIEECAIQLSAMQNTLTPNVDNTLISIFAGDHGIATKGVSAFPQAVTVEMLRNFVKGGAAISVLAKHHQADLAVVNCGTAFPLDFSKDELAAIRHCSVATGTQDFSQQAAMTEEQAQSALKIGADLIDEKHQQQSLSLFIGGEMGIGNTTSASAIACALLHLNAEKMVGRGTGIDDATLLRKTELIDQALARPSLISAVEKKDVLTIAAEVGGFEILALAGAYIRCAQLGVSILVDGFITTAAALLAMSLNENVRDWMIFSHQSHEQGHQRLLSALDANPLLDLNLRLGEGSGAALALALLQQSCVLHNQMATFADAGVSEQD